MCGGVVYVVRYACCDDVVDVLGEDSEAFVIGRLPVFIEGCDISWESYWLLCFPYPHTLLGIFNASSKCQDEGWYCCASRMLKTDSAFACGHVAYEE